MPFSLKNAPSEFQNIMNDILGPLSKDSIVYIDDVLIFSKSIEEHWKHLNSFLEVIKINGLVVFATKIKLFQTNIRFLGYNIHQSRISPISRVIQFANKFPDEILEKAQLQRFLGSLNYVAISIKTSRKNASHCLIDFKRILLHGLLTIPQLSKKLRSMSRHYLVSAFLLLSLLKSLRLMPPTLGTVVFLSSKFVPTNLNKLFVSIQVFGIQPKRIIVLLRKRFYLWYYAFQSFKMIS
jgi:hypothetical protein